MLELSFFHNSSFVSTSYFQITSLVFEGIGSGSGSGVIGYGISGISFFGKSTSGTFTLLGSFLLYASSPK